jgi:hypothetical protein
MGCGSSKSGQVVESQQIKVAKQQVVASAEVVKPAVAFVQSEVDVIKAPSPKKESIVEVPKVEDKKVSVPQSDQPLPNAIPDQPTEKVEEKKGLPPLKPTLKEANSELSASKKTVICY